MDEFALINHYFRTAKRNGADQGVIQGIGDDCAVLSVPAGQQLVVSIDTLVEGVHFLPDTAPDLLAWRLLGAAISDLAAMGATPAWVTLALTLPKADDVWLASFSTALHEVLSLYRMTLVGGDTTRGPLTLSAQVHGFVEPDRALLRQGAQVDDLICVTGTLGDSRAGLACLLDNSPVNAVTSYLRERFYKPTPRILTGQLLVGYASACLDISDGLLGDLNHLLEYGSLGAELDSEALPLSSAIRSFVDELQAQEWALSGGEDFELCFTISPEQWHQLQASLQTHNVQVTPIGRIVSQSGIRIKKNGSWVQVQPNGFNHFAGE